MTKNSIKPEQRTPKVNFRPTWSRGNILSMILSAPTFHKAETKSAHFNDVVDGFHTK